MKLVFDDLLGGSPIPYVRKVLKGCGQKRPPICHRTVTDHLGLELSDELPDDFPDNPKIDNPELHKALSTCCARLNRGKKEVWYYRHMNPQRARLSVFHEDTHFVCPWHTDIDIFECNENQVQGLAYASQEREAFGGGMEFLMPIEMVLGDILSFNETSLKVARHLAGRYDASIEVAAIRYARINPGICCFLIIEPNTLPLNQTEALSNGHNSQIIFPWNIPVRLKEIKNYPLRVRYAVASNRFPKFIKPGTGIEGDNLILNAWTSQKAMKGEIPASVFGSSEKWSYHAECIPIGNSGRIKVLLWLTDNQLSFKFYLGGNR